MPKRNTKHSQLDKSYRLNKVQSGSGQNNIFVDLCVADAHKKTLWLGMNAFGKLAFDVFSAYLCFFRIATLLCVEFVMAMIYTKPQKIYAIFPKLYDQLNLLVGC